MATMNNRPMRQVFKTEEKQQHSNLTEKKPSQHQQQQRQRPSSLRQQNSSTFRRSSSAPPRMGRKRHLLVEDHYRVDAETKSLLPGLPVNNDENDARDLHDFFNLIALE